MIECKPEHEDGDTGVLDPGLDGDGNRVLGRSSGQSGKGAAERESQPGEARASPGWDSRSAAPLPDCPEDLPRTRLPSPSRPGSRTPVSPSSCSGLHSIIHSGTWQVGRRRGKDRLEPLALLVPFLSQ